MQLKSPTSFRVARIGLFTPVLLVMITLATYRLSEPDANDNRVTAGQFETPRLPVLEMVDYADPVAGFDARVPQHWQRLLLQSPGDAGVTITFESPPSSDDDHFADYLMVDIQPGNVVEVLEKLPDERTLMTVAGQSVYRERIRLDSHPVADTQLDLVAWQLVLRQPGYSVAMYVVGERREEARLERVLIEFAYSFSMSVPPFLLTGDAAVPQRYG